MSTPERHEPPTYKLSVLTDEAGARALESALVALEDPQPLAVSRFEDGPVNWRIEAYFEGDAAWPALEPMLQTTTRIAAPTFEPVPPVNWVRHVEAMLSPVSAGRFLIHGPHDRAKAERHPLAIEIEAGEAFGTAHHGSTEGCLFAIGHVVPALSPQSVLDLGTGTGVLAIAVAKLSPNARIFASDIDPRSVEIAAENSSKNGTSDNIIALVATGLDHPHLAGPHRFDLIVANILAGPLVDLATGIVSGLRPDGRIILSGLLDKQAAEVLHAYAKAGAFEINRVTRGEWVTLVLGGSN